MEFDYSDLSERKKLILKAIIDAHIKNGEPVGSKYLTNEAKIPYSSATIRNEMAELEDLGYLEQPHTSAGRIPSELGYRFYVDTLVTEYDITSKEADQLGNMLSVKKAEIDKILENARKVVSAMTNYTAISLQPRPTSIAIRRYQVMYLDPHSFILIMVTSLTDEVKTKNITPPFEVTKEQIERLAVVLNEVLAGVALDDINISLMMKMEEKMPNSAELISVVVKSIYETMNALGAEVRVEGLNRLLQYPEYSNLDRLQQMISTFEDKSDIIKAISTIDQSDDETKVFIGSENMVKIMDNSTLIYKNLKLGGKTIGAIAIVGPCRMDYSKVLATIDKLSAEINGLSEIAMLPPIGEQNTTDKKDKKS